MADDDLADFFFEPDDAFQQEVGEDNVIEFFPPADLPPDLPTDLPDLPPAA